MSPTLFIVAGESSGDLHGASLARALRQRRPELALAGLGGPRMAEAGVDVVRDVTAHAAVGISEALASVRTVLKAFREMVALLEERRPDAVVLIDYPEFNLRFARRAHRRGIPVCYYISPQVWAWRQRRVRAIRRYVDRLLLVLPFEHDFYAAHGIEATFVGHPLLDVLHPYRHDRSSARDLGLPEDQFLLGLLPGSRKREVAALLPPMLGAAERLESHLGSLSVALAPAPSVPAEEYESWRGRTSLPFRLFPGKTYEVMAACDLLLVASGTATLEAGIIGTPMIVTYKVSPLSWLLARLLVRRIRYCSLVNLVADRQVVPELLQGEATAENIADHALALIREGRLEQVGRELAADVRPRLGQPGASGRAAEEILDLVEREGA
ncbi:MAG: lipid-A-disaccharide synthase [Candidatus Brocadiia bacterium]